MYKIQLSVIGQGSKRVRYYIERVEAATPLEAAREAKQRALEVYPNSTINVDEIWLRIAA